MGNEHNKDGRSSTTKTTTTTTTTTSKKHVNIRNAEDIKYHIEEFKRPNDKSINSTSPIRLLIISAHSDNFYELFANCTLTNGRKIIVEQAGWSDISMTSYSDSKCVCTLQASRKPIPNTPQNKSRSFIPDFLLLRNLCYTILPGGDRRNILFGFMHAQLPSINSLMSEYCMLDRPLMNAELVKLNRKYGQNHFPIIQHNYYPVSEEMIITPEYPLVVKIGPGHAGYGKMLLENHKQFGDLKSVVACTPHYCTAERYIEGQCDLRIQKIGTHYRVFKRVSVSGNWKTNTGSADITDMELLPRYKFWADVCGQSFGGMDIVTVDVLVSAEDGKEYILEFNGTASGFGKDEEDNIILREYTIEKMNEYFVYNTQTNTNDIPLPEEMKSESEKPTQVTTIPVTQDNVNQSPIQTEINNQTKADDQNKTDNQNEANNPNVVSSTTTEETSNQN